MEFHRRCVGSLNILKVRSLSLYEYRACFKIRGDFIHLGIIQSHILVHTLRVKMKIGVNHFLFGICHAFFFYGTSCFNQNAYLAHAIIFSGQTTEKSVFVNFQTCLIPANRR